ncbi:hypothetical protein HAX54_034634 [Datura stramonium]|uniref:Uncharacterized protein n=1 Tax=Datura stramonium TaxID=4076 RepID=A0ABS8SEL5_DATST|nr:hypothetical protein [Datura stramonium]
MENQFHIVPFPLYSKVTPGNEIVNREENYMRARSAFIRRLWVASVRKKGAVVRDESGEWISGTASPE